MPTTVAITGASGLIGSALAAALEARGDVVRAMVRHATQSPREITWNPTARLLDERALAGVDVIVNLAGETIGKRWSSARRRAIRESRIRGTETITAAIARTGRPITLINGSAVGYYGSRGDELLDEKSTNGRGYLAEVCRDWEAATKATPASRSRVVMMRSGVVLAEKGGALPEMLRPFKLGVGGKVGSGKQWLSWIDIDDMAAAILWLIDHPSISGPVNMVSPNPVTNEEFTRVASDVLKMPALVPVPAFALKVLFGEMASETLLASQRAVPAVLDASGFKFHKPELHASLTGSLPP